MEKNRIKKFFHDNCNFQPYFLPLVLDDFTCFMFLRKCFVLRKYFSRDNFGHVFIKYSLFSCQNKYAVMLVLSHIMF